MSTRNFDDPRWKAIRWACFKRDEFKCALCGCTGKPLQSHHLIPVSVNKALEFVLDNVISLCIPCHESIRGREPAYEEQFREMILFKKRQNRKFNKKVPRGQKWRPRNIHLRF